MSSTLLGGTFAFVPGIGPARETELRLRGIHTWERFLSDGLVLNAKLDRRIRDGIEEMRALVDERQWTEIARRLPVRERWRLYPALQDDATFLDIETGADGRPCVIGLWSARHGPRLFVRGANLGAFVDEDLGPALVTFNGAAFDVPVLERSFPGWKPPPIHLDLRTYCVAIGERGGLKSIEDRFGLGRPEHLRGVGGADAVSLWETFRRTGDADVLRLLLEYNLYDAVQLRSVAERCCEKLSERFRTPWSPATRFHRGDVLLDLTRAVDAIVARANEIDPDLFEDVERRALRL